MRIVTRLGFAVITLGSLLSVASEARAQLPPPDPRNVFIQDTKQERDRQKALRDKTLKPPVPASEAFDFQAPQIEFQRDVNKIKGTGGVNVSQGGVQVQADTGEFDTQTKSGSVEGNVLMTTPEGVFSADKADLNIDSETGDFATAQFEVEEGGYDVRAERARKLSEFEFALEGSSLSTCHCPDGGRPWEIVSSSCDITQEGYAHTYNTALYFEGLPILYTPWMAFPVKSERASGLLVPQWGYRNQDGFLYSQPLFLVADDSTDFTVTPFIETRSRYGSGLSFRKAFSPQSGIDSRVIYSYEGPRGSNLRGLNTTGYTDPTIDTNRFGAFYRHNWRPDPQLELPMEFLADVHYASDDFFIREIEDNDIGIRESQFLVSTAVLRGTVLDKITAESRLEYNQLMIGDDDLQFQRLPELVVGTTETFRPFGQNPYGLKLVSSIGMTSTDFVRTDGYEGWRTNVKPRVVMPFHVSNVLRGQFAAEINQTQYSLGNTRNPVPQAGVPDELDDSTARTLPVFAYNMGTSVERVFDLDRGNWFSSLIGLGAENEGLELRRIKHTIEPNVAYTYAPYRQQFDNPYFDQFDRYRELSVVTYGVTQRLYGRMLRPYERASGIPELSSSPDNLPVFDLGSSLMEFGRSMPIVPGQQFQRRQGEIRELVTFGVRQTYDFVEDRRDELEVGQGALDKQNDIGRTAFSDVNFFTTLAPSQYMALGFAANVDPATQSPTQYDTSIGFRDDRGDVLRARYSFIEENELTGQLPLSQIEGNLELKMTDRVRLGYYARYDEKQSDMLESRALMRFVNACNCWSIDVGVSDRINPDRQQFLVTFTFTGLGDITQNIGLPQDDTQAQ